MVRRIIDYRTPDFPSGKRPILRRSVGRFAWCAEREAEVDDLECEDAEQNAKDERLERGVL